MADNKPRTEEDIILAEKVSDAGELQYCYKEIANLLWIDSQPIYKVALQEWERKSHLLTERVERKKKQSGDLRNEIYNLVGFFSVFQGVLLTAVAQSNWLLCRNWWSPFTLTLLASLVTIAGVGQKFRVIGDLEETIRTEGRSQKEVVKRVNELRREGPNFKFSKFGDVEKSKNTSKRSLNYMYMFLVISALVSFSVVFLVSHPMILCQSGATTAGQP